MDYKTMEQRVRNIPDKIIDRAVELWCRALLRPHHDNGDRSWTGSVGQTMAGMLSERHTSAPGYHERIERFRQVLTRDLRMQRDRHGDPMPIEEQEKLRRGDWVPRTYWFSDYLATDYGPGPTLVAASDEVGLDHSVFSIKSSVCIHDDCVSARFGHGALTVYHYPLPDGGWLLTDLCGKDVSKIVEYVMGGRPTFEVEPASVPTAPLPQEVGGTWPAKGGE